MIFRKFSKNFPTTFENSPTESKLLYNKDLTDRLFVPCGTYLDLSFLYGPHFIRSVCQNCSPSNSGIL